MNDWSPEKTPLTYHEGNWEAEVDLNPGFYQYQFIVDGKWVLDPANPDSADNNNGGRQFRFSKPVRLAPTHQHYARAKFRPAALPFSMIQKQPVAP